MQIQQTARLVATAALCASGCCLAQSRELSLSQTKAIKQIGAQALDDGIVGLSIAVSIDNNVVFASGFGHADLAETKPATEHTIYDIASVGKQFTAAGIIRLIEEGKVSLDDRIRDFVPETPSHFPNVTIQELLNHTSGFVDGELDELNPPTNMSTRTEGLDLLDDPALVQGTSNFEPSETWIYSNAGYLLLGLAIESASGQPYSEYIVNELLIPAGTTSMTVCQRPDSQLMSDSLYRTEEGVSKVPVIHMSAYGGQGSICSSVLDLLTWEAAIEDHKLFSEYGMTTFRSPARVRGNSGEVEIPYGAAQRMGTIDGHPKVGHSGTYEGGSASLAHYPDDNLTIAIATNTRGQGAPHAMAIETNIAKMLLDIKEVPAASQRQPLTEEECQRINGVYLGTNSFEAKASPNGELLVFKDGKLTETIVHTGGLVFRDESNPAVKQWFIMDGDTAGWWAYEANIFLMEILTREQE
jgi:D-alanyl-D-alanine carboxypeptidase